MVFTEIDAEYPGFPGSFPLFYAEKNFKKN